MTDGGKGGKGSLTCMGEMVSCDDESHGGGDGRDAGGKEVSGKKRRLTDEVEGDSDFLFLAFLQICQVL